MLYLYHIWLSAPSRAVRVALSEYDQQFELLVEKPWDRRREFLALNPAGTLPVLYDTTHKGAISGMFAILEFLDETHSGQKLMGDDSWSRAECRRLMDWFFNKCQNEVIKLIVDERVHKRFYTGIPPDAAVIRAGITNLGTHMSYLEWLLRQRSWLIAEHMVMADIVASAYLSTLDYLDVIDWDKYPETKAWYAKMKSRPSFRAILGDYIRDMKPSEHYSDLDF